MSNKVVFGDPIALLVDNIGQAIVTIFIISTGDNWQDIMYVAMDSTGKDTAPERDANKGAAAFFVFSILFAMMLWANLFVSALVDNFTTLAVPVSRFHDGQATRMATSHVDCKPPTHESLAKICSKEPSA